MIKSNLESLKVGMVLEWYKSSSDDSKKVIEIAKDSNIDLLVFPEKCTLSEIFSSESCMSEYELSHVYTKCFEISKEVGKPIIFGLEDSAGRLYSIYVNADAKAGETQKHCYIKHVMTPRSAFDEEDYPQLSTNQFKPIILNGFNIGLTICYECEFPIFSRMYGLQGVDLIINCTGNGVIPHKWGLFNKVRAIENRCSVLVTMKYRIYNNGCKSRTFGYNSLGGELTPININGPSDQWIYNGIYVYDVGKPDNDTITDIDNIHAERAENKNYHIDIPLNDIEQIISISETIDTDVFCYHINNQKENLIICLVDGMDILRPEEFLPKLYLPKLKAIKNKRYILVNRHKTLSEEQLYKTISPILKVRAMENFIVVILESDKFSKCYQTSFNKMSQSVLPTGNVFKIDISRATGPEATWKDKNQDNMLKKWRANYEWLIGNIQRLKV